MTCIVGLVDKGTVYMGGDSAGVAGYSISVRADEKVFINGPFIMGFTSSFRMGQLLRYKFKCPEQTTDQTDMEYMVITFIDAVRELFSENGFGSMQDKADNKGGNFLVGYKGNLYNIDNDFQVGRPSINYDSVGCGSDIAMGALYASSGKKAEARVELALTAASEFSAGVVAPFTILKLSKNGK